LSPGKLGETQPMSRISRNDWIAIIAIAVIIVSLLALFFVPLVLSQKSSNQNAITPTRNVVFPNGEPTQRSGTPPLNKTPAMTSSPTIAGVQLIQLSSDPYTDPASQPQTEVEPGSYSFGSTIVSAFQAGRFSDVGSSNIGWATSPDGGMTWQHGFLPGTTKIVGGSYDRITDPAVAYDAAHNTWMIATTVFVYTSTGIVAPAVVVSLSTNGGSVWSRPVTIADVGNVGELDKDWIVCDDTATSRFYGNCYAEWDNYAKGNLIQMSTSNDGGNTWGAAKTTADYAAGTSGYPLVQPDGTVIVPISNANQTALIVFTSNNGGASWSRTTTVAAVTSFSQHAYFRDDILLAPGIDSAGQVYLVWVDCRFERNCNGNDLVMSTSTDGAAWSAVQRIPIAPIGSGVNYYVSGLGIDQNTAGPTTHLGLAFYYYTANCFSNCSLSVGFVSSIDGGATWSAKRQLAGPIPASWIARGNNKVGDYITTCFSNGRAFPIFAGATAPSGGHLNEAMYTVEGGLDLALTTTATPSYPFKSGLVEEV
jgi:BNR repeat-like domain